MARANDWADQKLRKQFRAACAAVNAPCALCGKSINYGLPYRDPRTRKVNRWSFSVEHATAIAEGGGQRDVSNLRASHLTCNVRDGNRIRLRAKARATTSRVW